MKTFLFVAFLVVLVNFAECSNFHKSVASSVANLGGEHKRATGDSATCYQASCVASNFLVYLKFNHFIAGSSCVESAACKSCNSQFETCLSTTANLCGCATQFVQCAVMNATDDRVNCNPTVFRKLNNLLI